jgi:putative FmdB family regulatory protein
MPIYEYECRKCGVFDHAQSIADRPLNRCPKCRSKVTKLISATAFHLKGGGWYADGYDRKKASDADAAVGSGADKGAGASESPAAKEGASSEAKPKKSKEKVTATSTGDKPSAK